jgi:hypothetical protein
VATAAEVGPAARSELLLSPASSSRARRRGAIALRELREPAAALRALSDLPQGSSAGRLGPATCTAAHRPRQSPSAVPPNSSENGDAFRRGTSRQLARPRERKRERLLLYSRSVGETRCTPTNRWAAAINSAIAVE